MTRTMQHVVDVETDESWLLNRDLVRERGWRSTIHIPMLRGGDAVGTIGVSRAQPGAFSPDEIALLETFADQAVIAIENVRLFKELQERNRQVTDALEQQTATSEILRVISQSPTDTQPVFDAIVQSARGLLDAHSAAVFRTVGQDIHLGAYTSTGPGGDEDITSFFPKPLAWLAREGPDFARPWVDGGIEHVADLGAGSDEAKRMARARGYRSRVTVPMRREGTVIGALSVTRREAGLFSDVEIGLLRTFADQAVIAIENVRLFTELQTSNRELTTALDTQTATSDILRVISRSQTDVQPVFDAIVDSAVRLLTAVHRAR